MQNITIRQCPMIMYELDINVKVLENWFFIIVITN